MTNTNIITKAILVPAFLLVFLTAVPAMGLTDEEIFTWVSGELNIEKQYEMPKIQYVTQDELSVVFRRNNERSYRQWASTYGEAQADEWMAFYLKEVIGLFIPKTGDLFVGSFLSPCKRESIVAHELTHFIQFMENGPIDPKDPNAGNKHMFNEMQAGNIEKTFMKQFCSSASAD